MLARDEDIVFKDERAEAIWTDGKLEWLTQLRDALLGASLLAFIIIPFLAFRALGLVGVDPDLLSVLSWIDKWGTVVVFGIFWISLIVRSAAGMRSARR